MRCLWLPLALLLLLALPAPAQEVSDDEVNAVAARLYCPVCEYVPLDDCETPACRQWRAEIRFQLNAGRPPQAIIDEFVARYGQQVMGAPTDPALRALALVTPLVLTLAALLLGAARIRRWRRRGVADPATQDAPAPPGDYRARIEADLRARR